MSSELIIAATTLIGAFGSTFLGAYLNRRVDHPDDELVRELRRQLKAQQEELKRK